MLAATTPTIPAIIGAISLTALATIIIRQRIESSKTRRTPPLTPTPLLHEARTRKTIAELRTQNRALIRENSRLHGEILQLRKAQPAPLNVIRYPRTKNDDA